MAEKEIGRSEQFQKEMVEVMEGQTFHTKSFLTQMQNNYTEQGNYWKNSILAADIQTKMLTLIEKNTFQTADLLANYIDEFKDASRRQAEAALEASRKKDTKGGGKDIENLGGLDLDFGTIASGLIGGVGAAALGFKDKLINFFKGTETDLKSLDKPKKGFFDGIKKFLGFGPPDLKDVEAKKLNFKSNIDKFLKFGDTDVATAGVQKTQFKNSINRQLAWAADTEKLTDASKLKFIQNQEKFLKWGADAEPNSLFSKTSFLDKQKSLLTFVASADPDSAAAKMKFIDDQAKFLKFAEDAPTKTLDQKTKFLKSIGDSLDIPAGNVDASKIAKDSFFKKQLDMLDLKPSDIDGLELKKVGLFDKMKTKVFSLGEGVVDGVTAAKNTFSTKMTGFFKLPILEEGSALMKVKNTFLLTLDDAMGVLLKITNGFFKLVNILNFGALDYLNPEALKNPMKTFESFKASMGSTFGKEGIMTKAADLFKSIIAPLDDIIKPLKDILGFVGKIAKVVGKIFIPIGFLFSAFDVISNIVDGYKEGGITGAIGAGIESIFDDVLFAIPNLLGEAVAWVLKKFGFENATEFIDKNLRDKDGNFSLFNGIKNLFTMAVDALYDSVITPVMDYFKKIPQIIAGMMIDLGVPDWITKKVFSEETVNRANLEREDPVAYNKMMEAERKQRELERELERQKAAAAQASLVQDNSQTVQNVNNKIEKTRPSADSNKDSLKKTEK
tara:strand:- start:91 stop:2274 length:2184 start_codon:yes stop_codon:yes gene_type:complete